MMTLLSENKILVFSSSSAEDTQQIAISLGKVLQGGEVLSLVGTLGAGKTCFVQGLAAGLEVPDSVIVRSPTFTLWESYEGRLLLNHFDLYRLTSEDELELIGWRESFSKQEVSVVEWGDLFDRIFPKERLEVTIEIVQQNERKIRISGLQHLPAESLLLLQSDLSRLIR